MFQRGHLFLPGENCGGQKKISCSQKFLQENSCSQKNSQKLISGAKSFQKKILPGKKITEPKIKIFEGKNFQKKEKKKKKFPDLKILAGKNFESQEKKSCS